MKGIIVLFGAEKSGKTTTLKLLSDYFAGKTCMFDKHGDYKMVVKQNNSYVYVSSAGDDLPAIEDSIAFFKGKWPNKKRGARKALLINGGEMTGIDTDEKKAKEAAAVAKKEEEKAAAKAAAEATKNPAPAAPKKEGK